MNSFSSMYLQVLGSSLKRFTVWIIQMICSLRLNIHFIALKKQGTTDGFFSESCVLFHLYIISEFTISVARLRMLFIFCTHNVSLSAFNFSGIFFFGKCFYKFLKRFLGLFFNGRKIFIQFFRSQKIVISYSMKLFKILPMTIYPHPNI